MKIVSVIIGLTILLMSCKSGTEAKTENVKGMHKVVVEEVLHSGGYTYLKVKEDDKEQWLAVNKMEVVVGETFYYTGGMTMTDFESESLERTFEEIIFLDNISKEPISQKESSDKEITVSQHHGSVAKNMKQMINIEPAEDRITIAELYKNKDKYDGKKVVIRGQVTKFNADIMNTNWIHIQDGTDNEGDYDLIVNSDAVLEVGEIVTLKGKIILNKDLGNGYIYKILMEDAVIK